MIHKGLLVSPHSCVDAGNLKRRDATSIIRVGRTTVLVVVLRAESLITYYFSYILADSMRVIVLLLIVDLLELLNQVF